MLICAYTNCWKDYLFSIILVALSKITIHTWMAIFLDSFLFRYSCFLQLHSKFWKQIVRPPTFPFFFKLYLLLMILWNFKFEKSNFQLPVFKRLLGFRLVYKFKIPLEENWYFSNVEPYDSWTWYICLLIRCLISAIFFNFQYTWFLLYLILFFVFDIILNIILCFIFQ